MARIFRAHWTDDSAHQGEGELEVYGSRSARARDGLRLLMETERISVDMLDAADWEMVFSLTEGSESVKVFRHERSALPDGWEEFEYDAKRAAYEVAWTEQPAGRAAAIETRVAADEYYVRFLERLRTTELEGERPPLREAASAASKELGPPGDGVGCEECA